MSLAAAAAASTLPASSDNSLTANVVAASSSSGDMASTASNAAPTSPDERSSWYVANAGSNPISVNVAISVASTPANLFVGTSGAASPLLAPALRLPPILAPFLLDGVDGTAVYASDGAMPLKSKPAALHTSRTWKVGGMIISHCISSRCSAGAVLYASTVTTTGLSSSPALIGAPPTVQPFHTKMCIPCNTPAFIKLSASSGMPSVEHTGAAAEVLDEEASSTSTARIAMFGSILSAFLNNATASIMRPSDLMRQRQQQYRSTSAYMKRGRQPHPIERVFR